MLVLAWLILGIVLVAVEMHHLAFYALFGAAGAFAAALVTAFFPDAYALQVGVAVAVAGIGIVAVRPFVSKAMHRRHDGPLGRGVHGSLVGEEVITLDLVGDPHHVGHVRLVGERWLAISGSEHPIPAGTRVVVTAVQGTTLVVWPIDGVVHPLDDAFHPPSELPPAGSAEPPPAGAKGEQP